jgi:uncharacterized protein YjgD (DUF1641 family)
MDSELVSLHQKIDLLTAQVETQRQRLEALEAQAGENSALHQKLDYLVGQAQAQQKQRQEFDELKGDVIPIANHMVKLSIDELAEIGSDFQLEDLLFLLKRTLRDTRMIVTGLDRLESMMELYDESQRLGKQVFSQTVTTLDRMERDGYFSLARSGWQIIERIVHEFSAEDLSGLGDRLVEVLNSLKNSQELDGSLGGLLRQMRNPETRRGLALTLRILQAIGTQATELK